MTEPSILDLLREKLRFRKVEPNAEKLPGKIRVPIFTIVAVLLCLYAQTFLEAARKQPINAVVFYAIAAVAIVLAVVLKEWKLPDAGQRESRELPLTVRWIPLVISFPFLALAFITFGGNRFTTLNVFLWVIGLVLVLVGLWQPKPRRRTLGERFHSLQKFRLRITPWTIFIVLTVLLIVFFRFYQLNQVPGEMFSDHAEKLLDVSDVLHGQYSIFFPRNTGREAIQMYLTAGIATLLGTGLSFISLKIGTALCGLLALPYIYLLGKEMGNRWVGWAALFLTGIAYWPNVISRIGLRFPLYPLFVAPCLFYLIRGLKYSKRNDLLLSGLALGIGMHGYSPMRFVPFAIVIGFLIFALRPSSRGKRVALLWGLILLAFVALVVFLPLFRYALSDWQGFSNRAFSRLFSNGEPLPKPGIVIFLDNLLKVDVMFFYDNGSIWVHSIPGRPALEIITAVFFFIGLFVLIARFIKQRTWEDLFLVLSIPLLMMPSILSIAFPDENPSLNRTAGAIIPVFIIAGFGLVMVFSTFWDRLRSKFGKVMTILCACVLLGFSIRDNYNLVFIQFKNEFLAGAWNTSDIGKVIRGFVDSGGDKNSAFVVPFPYWVDTRLVGINAGFPDKDYALWPDSFADTLALPNPKLFILKGDDLKDLETLKQYYPHGNLSYHIDSLEGKDFMMYYVPAQ
jgi:hypothetical protein